MPATLGAASPAGAMFRPELDKPAASGNTVDISIALAWR